MAKFYNSSIVSFSESATFGGEVTLDCNLVDCGADGDSFSPPTEGTPTLFSYDGHTFYGLLDRYTRSDSSSGHPQYTVQLSNGQFLLGGTQLILNDYYGVTNGVPNLINVFGYLENSGGFGASEINSAGISWSKIYDVVGTVVNNPAGTSYGGPILHKSFKYGIDLSDLPPLPAYYRINNTSISLLEFIEEICEAGGHDYIIKLENTAPLGLNGIFKVYTMSRLNEPTSGKIQDFVNSQTCVISKEVGKELRKDPTSKMVVGANVERMWMVTPPGTGLIYGMATSGGISQSEYADFTVLPYYGLDLDGNYIVGETHSIEPNEYYFDIDIRDLEHSELGPTYTTCLGELRAAKKSRESWEVYIAKRSCNKYIYLPEASCGAPSIRVEPFALAYETTSHNQIYKITGAGYPTYTDSNGDTIAYFTIPKYGYLAAYNYMNSFVQNNRPVPNNFDVYDHYITPVMGLGYYDGGSYSSCLINNYMDTGKLVPILLYAASDTLNPYFGRAFKIKTLTDYTIPFTRLFETDLYQKATNVAFTPDAGDRAIFLQIYNQFKATLGIDQYSAAVLNKYNAIVANRYRYVENMWQEKANRLYRRINDLASNYMGKRYMVTIPSMYAAIEPESNSLRVSQQPTDAGYIDSSQWASAYASGLIPEVSGLNILMTPEEKFYSFVKYDEANIKNSGTNEYHDNGYDLGEISPPERIYGNPYYAWPDGTGEFVALDLWFKTSVMEQIVYLDNTTLLGPRAVVELPGQVGYDPLARNYGSLTQLYADIMDFGKDVSTGAFNADTSFNSNAVSKALNKPGIDELKLHEEKRPLTPDLFAIPLRSNILTYGPWYISGANGPVIFEKNDDLAPWNYNGYTGLDLAGYARVNDGVTNQTFDETGSVSVAGGPSLSVGDQLISGGPYITDISVSIGSDGISTQYSFQTWSSQRRLSKLTNFQSERIKRLSQTSRDLRRAFREGLKNNLWKTGAGFLNDIRGKFIGLEDYPRRDNSFTSHKVISGDGTSVVIQPLYNAVSQQEDNYQSKAIMSLEGLFRPVSLWPSSDLPSMTYPSAGASEPTSLDLNPFKVGHDITVLTNSKDGAITDAGADGQNIEVEVDSSGVPDYRPFALRGPLMIAGWGKDTAGDPVPLYVDNEGNAVLDNDGNKQWDPDYLRDQTTWKVGPLDARWNESRGVWVAGGSEGVRHIRFTIVSVTDGSSSVFGSYDAWDAGYTADDVPGDLNVLTGVPGRLGVVEIHDPNGCFFDEPSDELFARQGYAHYMLPIGGYSEPRWEVTSLCCRRLSCNEGN